MLTLVWLRGEQSSLLLLLLPAARFAVSSLLLCLAVSSPAGIPKTLTVPCPLPAGVQPLGGAGRHRDARAAAPRAQAPGSQPRGGR